MWTTRLRLWRFTLCILFAVSALAITARAEEVPSESQCRPYIEKALKELETGDSEQASEEKNDSSEVSLDDVTKERSSNEDGGETTEAGDSIEDEAPSVEVADEPYVSQASVENVESAPESGEDKEEGTETAEDQSDDETEISKEGDDDDSKQEEQADKADDDDSQEPEDVTAEKDKSDEDAADASAEESTDGEDAEDSKADDDDGSQEKAESQEAADDEDSHEAKEESKEEEDTAEEKEESKEGKEEASTEDSADGGVEEQSAEEEKSGEAEEASEDEDKEGKTEEAEGDDGKSDEAASDEGAEQADEPSDSEKDEEDKDGAEAEVSSDTEEKTTSEEEEGAPEEDLLLTGVIPENLRSRDHINQILRLDEEASEAEILIEKSADIILRDLKKIYENSIKPLEVLYKYRDLSNRHFGDPEIFSKPLVLFMGPWSGGKSSITNYLTGLEFTEWSLRTGAEPSPAYFNILMHGKEPEVLDGTQLAADWTFAGLQKFGQGLEERLRGLKYPSKILEKVNIVEIPGILEVRKQVSRVFPFNDACQWFIDRADIIFLVYDPSKLDVGPETEAILDQLKGRESQTRIVLNKADTVKPEELMRVQSALIWNISPLMSSAQPPVMYTVSLWSMPYEAGAPVRLLQAQERELLRDLRQAIDKRIENKISSARRFAVRVRNHAKMVDCYLTTYYNHKTIFGNRKLIADAIIENPQNYHIYEGLSTLTNISRYDLPDPETYRDFFRLNPLYEFQQLSATCTYFRGCPITRLDVAIAYDLPELVGKYKKMVETATPQGMPKS
ncbi:sarcalumenin [Phthorimaea operculella]|nr:sarcalumenin [Phthorimaea operculella]